ncbi:MAG: indole-3-glycerol phosphate synthase TrpC [Bacteroidota bacterium]
MNNIRAGLHQQNNIKSAATKATGKATILDEIIAAKRIEVALNKQFQTVQELEQKPYFERTTLSLKASVKQHSGIITEFKRRSPSKGIINDTVTVASVVSGYDVNGASGISILTDTPYFGGSNSDLLEGRIVSSKPILRKDFIIDEYQIIEAKAIGADVILLIAANLTVKEVKQFAKFAKSLNLEVLLELHTEIELDHICDEIDLIGINNRNLKNFEVNLEHAINLAAKLPADKPRIAESGINNVESILYLKQQGFDGFLIGEYFMKEPEPAIAFANLVTKLPW